MIIRDFNIYDHDNVFRVAKESWDLAYSKYYSIEFLEERLNEWYSYDNHKGMLEGIKNNILLFKVCIDNNEIIAFISGNLKEGCLHRMYIKPQNTRQGIGKTLLDIFNDELLINNINICKTTCDKNNNIGLNFYIKNGFIIKGEDDEDYLLEKDVQKL